MSADRAMRGHPRGFTLLEILVALVVLGFLMVGLVQGTRSGLVFWARQGQAIATHDELDSVDRALRGLLERMDPGTIQQPIQIQGGPHALGFTTDLPLSAGALPVRRVDAGLGVDGEHRLVLRWTPRLHAKRIGAAPEMHQEVLLRGVTAIDLSYWGAAGPQSPGGWTGNWPPGKALPGLIRLRITFDKGDRRRWPDIVIRPIRDRPEEAT